MDIRIPNSIRFLSMDAVQKAKSGHPGMPMGMADIASVLFTEFIKINPKDPEWPNRDRFVLSNGHGSMLIYSLLYLLGYKEPTLKDIKEFRKVKSKTPGHPEYRHTKGIETTTGPLGQGLGNAVGMALAEKILNKKFGSSLIDHFTYVFAGDGCMMEGISHEVLSFSGHLKLNKLIVFYDDNDISIDGPTSLTFTDNSKLRMEAYGWNYIKINGHDHNQIRNAIKKAKISKKPTMIACKTKIGYGSPNKQGSHESHGAALGDEEIKLTREKLNWPYKPFEIPKDILNHWRMAGKKSQKKYNNWKKKVSEYNYSNQFKSFVSKKIDKRKINKIIKHFNDKTDGLTKASTRKASQLCLDSINKFLDSTIGGSADLTPSNNTKSKDLNILSKDNMNGRYIHYGVREHGMASIMNGLSLHSGFIPYGGTFLVFSDYCRPSIRLSAMMNAKVIYIMTHDSIGLGEDGPTHQPVEHLTSLRLIPNLKVFRPCDLNETLDCWINALNYDGASVLALSRQDLPILNQRTKKRNEFFDKYNSNLIFGSLSKRDITFIATGSEVEIANRAAMLLKNDNIAATVVSIPCVENFMDIKKSDREMILGNGHKIYIEAGVPTGWKSFFDESPNFIGVNRFGASGPKDDVYKELKITSESLIKTSIELLR
ncbi:transketolase [bacterium]|nr:transketolase [bacterium]